MKQKILRIMLLSYLFILVTIINMPFADKSDTKVFTLPGLPQPIAKEPIVITSAGQGTDTYIIRDISNQLMIRSFFMPQARETDLKDMKTVVFVVGYSSLGSKLQGTTYEEEKSRIERLLKKAEDDNITILAIVTGGEKPRDKNTEELLMLIGNNADYLIGLRDSSSESILVKLAKDKDIPLSLVNEAGNISEPFASAFR